MVSSVLSVAPLLLPLLVSAHGHNPQTPIAPEADWATRHLAEEHHINNFDAGVFFQLHDFDSTGKWSSEDIRRTYGLYHESADSIHESRKEEVARVVMEMFDIDHSGYIEYDEFVSQVAAGKSLPDFGLGPGHHGDDEYEYEIHHFEKYHGDDATEDELTHPEDIEHFRKHEQKEAEQQAWEEKANKGIVDSNIPQKFRRPGF